MRPNLSRLSSCAAPTEERSRWVRDARFVGSTGVRRRPSLQREGLRCIQAGIEISPGIRTSRCRWRAMSSRTSTNDKGEERDRLWKLAAQQWPDYDAYQTKTDRRSRSSYSNARPAPGKSSGPAKVSAPADGRV